MTGDDETAVTVAPPLATRAALRQLAHFNTRYGYFVVPGRQEGGMWVSCPTCKARVHAWLPYGKRGAHAEVRALHEAVLSHLRETDTGCAPTPR